MSRGFHRVGVYAACVREGRILLCRMSSRTSAPGRWTLPGGGLEFGEPPAKGVIREVQEETGMVAEVGALIAVHDNVYTPHDGTPRHGIRLIFAASVAGEPRAEVRGGGTDAADWWPLGAAPEDLTPWAQAAINAFEVPTD